MKSKVICPRICSLICLLFSKKCFGGFVEFPTDGNHWEFKPLILRWSHDFTNIRGCVWSYIGESHNTDFTFISYGTKEGLEIKILGWELLDISQPCAGGIVKKNSTLSDIGRYEMRVVARSIVRSKAVTIGIINRKDRSVHILTGLITTELIPGRHENMTVYVGIDGRCVVILNDKYPDDTCTSVHRIGRNEPGFICNKTFELNMDNGIREIQIVVPLDIADSATFVFNVRKEGQTETLNSDCLSKQSIDYVTIFFVTLSIILAVLHVGICLKCRRWCYIKRSNLGECVIQRRRGHLSNIDALTMPESNPRSSHRTGVSVVPEDEEPLPPLEQLKSELDAVHKHINTARKVLRVSIEYQDDERVMLKNKQDQAVFSSE